MEPDPIQNDLRKTLRARRLPSDAACEQCGVADPPVLVHLNRSLLERRHVAGAANDLRLDLIVCRNCHALLTEDQRDFAISFGKAVRPNLLERLMAVLLGIATVFMRWVNTLCLLADGLDRVIGWLDEHARGWREAEVFASWTTCRSPSGPTSSA